MDIYGRYFDYGDVAALAAGNGRIVSPPGTVGPLLPGDPNNADLFRRFEHRMLDIPGHGQFPLGHAVRQETRAARLERSARARGRVPPEYELKSASDTLTRAVTERDPASKQAATDKIAQIISSQFFGS